MSWIAECDSGHPTVLLITSFAHNEQSFVPTRLIKVEKHLKDHVQLVSPFDSVRYVALSYCWGTTEQSRTITTNIRSRERRFAVAQLPQTLKDAIFLTRALGIQYVWIDSLCIVQDDPEEWAIESAKMASIYSST